LEEAQATLPNTIVTISGNTSVTMRVPWAQQTPWLFVRSTGSNNAARLDRSANGYLHFYVVNPVTSNGSSAPLPVNIYFSSDNIRFAAPKPEYIPYYTDMMVPAAPDSGVITFLSGEVLIVPATEISFGPKSDLRFVGLRAFGETPMSVKELAQKMVPYISTQITLTTNDEGKFVTISTPATLPVGLQDRVVIPAVAPAANIPGTSAAVEIPTWLGYFAAAFVGVRGSTRRAFTYDKLFGAAGGEASIHWAAHSPWVPSTTGGTSTVSLTAPTGFDEFINKYSVVASNKRVTPMLEVVVPSMIANDFFVVGDQLDSRSHGRVYHMFQVDSALAASSLGWTQWVACGDDMTFCRFVGFPSQNAAPSRS